MPSLFPLLSAMLALSSLSLAVEDDNPKRHVHAAVAFIRTGTRTPLLDPSPKRLTPLGAHEMFTLGQQLRGRYLGDAAFDGMGHEPIEGLNRDVLNPSQVLVQTLDRPYLIASAQACMQGLYPPRTLRSALEKAENGTGSTDPLLGDASGLLANGSAIDFPLGGYQYVPIESLSSNDMQSIFLSGERNCRTALRESVQYQTTNEYLLTRAESKAFFNSLKNYEGGDLFDGLLSGSQIDYYNALSIHDYLTYGLTHSQTIHDAFLSPTSPLSDSLPTLQAYADESAWYTWGNTTFDETDRNAWNPSLAQANLRAIPGRTVAGLVLNQFQEFFKPLDSGGGGFPSQAPNPVPLTLLFGEYEPFVSLFSLLLLDHRNPHFRSVPPFGSAVVFELFSSGSSPAFPGTTDTNNLWVNFFYQNGTTFDADNGTWRSYPLFGESARGTDTPWAEFERMMGQVATTGVGQWCEACNATTVFCQGLDGVSRSAVVNGFGSQRSRTKAVALSALAGAVVTLGVVVIVALLASMLGGYGIQRDGGHGGGGGGFCCGWRKKSKSDLGGFKGSAKLASDADLNLPRNGVVPAGVTVDAGAGDGASAAKSGHERVGSWELRQNEGGGGRAGQETGSRRPSLEGMDDADLALARPVLPRETV